MRADYSRLTLEDQLCSTIIDRFSDYDLVYNVCLWSTEPESIPFHFNQKLLNLQMMR